MGEEEKRRRWRRNSRKERKEVKEEEDERATRKKARDLAMKRRKMKKWIMTGKEIRNEGRKRRSFPRIPEVKTGRRQMKISTMKMRKAAKLATAEETDWTKVEAAPSANQLQI